MPRTPLLSALSLLALLLAAAPARAGRFEDRALQGRRYQVFVPAMYHTGQPTPLVVLLHGCTQDPATFARATRIAEAAERRGWLVLLPEQPASANQNRCWNWFEAAHQGRDAGEPRWIAACVQDALREWSVDRERVYVAGLSAGAAMSVIMGVTWPDLFAAVGVGAGLEYEAATGMVEAFAAMRQGGPDPARQARRALSVMGPRARAVPAIVVQGSADTTVAPVNGEQVAAMWVALSGQVDPAGAPLAAPPAQQVAPGGLRYEVQDWADPAGRVCVRKVVVQGMAHAWSGGSRDGTFVDPAGPDATELCLDFFAAHTLSGLGSVPPPAPAPPAPAPAPTAPAPIAPTPIAPTPIAPTPIAPTPIAPAPIAPTPIAPAPLAPPSGRTIELLSGPEQGWVGRFLAHGAGAGQPFAGDDGMFDPDRYRALLSFDTRALPAGGRVERVVLRLRRESLEGTIDALSVDLRQGVFGRGPEPERGDHGAAPTLAGLVSFAPPASDGAWIEVDLGPGAVRGLDRQGLTQLRLRAIGPAAFKPNRLRIAEARLVVTCTP